MSVARAVDLSWRSAPVAFIRSAPAATANPGFSPSLIQLLPELHRRARYFAEQAAEAQDLVQETCRRAIEARARFVPGSDLRAWLFCIMRNIHCDRMRSKGREILVGGGWEAFPEFPRDARPVWLEATDEDLGLAFAALTSPYREAFHLRTVERLGYGEIARRLGIPINTVGTQLRRARRQIRQFLEHRMGVACPLPRSEGAGRPQRRRAGPSRPPRDRGRPAERSRIG
jgi:RNA polymerase sigma-70 factor, ECF subfamily